MSKNFIVRHYSHGDEAKIVELLEFVFRGWPNFDINCTTREHWTWKYLVNPYNVNIINIAAINDKIIGVNHSVIKKVKLGEKYTLTGVGADVAVHPDFRRLGVFNALIEFRDRVFNENKIRYWSAISSNSILIKRNIRVGNFIFPKKISYLVNIKDVKLYLQHSNIKNKSLFYYGYKIMNVLNSLINSFKFYKSNIVIKNIEFFNEEVNLLWKM